MEQVMVSSWRGWKPSSSSLPSSSLRKGLPRPQIKMTSLRVCAESQSANDGVSVAVTPVSQFKHLLFPIIDRNPYLSEATRQAAAAATTLAKKYGAKITVVVIDEEQKESIPDHDVRMNSIQWHLNEGGFQEFGLMERQGEGKQPAAVIGEIADEMGHDLVVLSMDAIHAKHIDANLLAEFLPCPVMLLPL